MILALLFGLAIGVPLGLLGGGGSVLAVPALVYGLGQPVRTAIPTSLLVVAVSSAGAAASYLRAHRVLWRTALAFGLSGVGASFVGAWVSTLISDSLLLAGYAVLMVVAATGLLRNARRAARTRLGAGAALPKDEWAHNLPRIVTAGVGVGFVTSLFGIGGGFLIAPALVFLLRIPVHVAIGTSLLVLFLNASSGFLAHLSYGGMELGLTAFFGAGGIGGALIGSKLSPHVDATRLLRWIAYAILLVAAFVVSRTLLVGAPE